jgi:hypothetical protein
VLQALVQRPKGDPIERTQPIGLTGMTVNRPAEVEYSNQMSPFGNGSAFGSVGNVMGSY